MLRQPEPFDLGRAPTQALLTQLSLLKQTGTAAAPKDSQSVSSRHSPSRNSVDTTSVVEIPPSKVVLIMIVEVISAALASAAFVVVVVVTVPELGVVVVTLPVEAAASIATWHVTGHNKGAYSVSRHSLTRLACVPPCSSAAHVVPYIETTISLASA